MRARERLTEAVCSASDRLLAAPLDGGGVAYGLSQRAARNTGRRDYLRRRPAHRAFTVGI